MKSIRWPTAYTTLVHRVSHSDLMAHSLHYTGALCQLQWPYGPQPTLHWCTESATVTFMNSFHVFTEVNTITLYTEGWHMLLSCYVCSKSGYERQHKLAAQYSSGRHEVWPCQQFFCALISLTMRIIMKISCWNFSRFHSDEWYSGKFHPITCHEGTELESRYSSTLSLILALDEGWWSMPRPDSFTPGNDLVPTVVDPRTGTENVILTRKWSLDCPSSSKSPYRLLLYIYPQKLDSYTTRTAKYNCNFLCFPYYVQCQSQWPHGLRHRSTAARLLRSWVWIPLGAWIFVCCECCVLSGRGLCDELITRPEESYRMWCVVVCDLWGLEL